jgi:hypothetical protein
LLPFSHTEPLFSSLLYHPPSIYLTRAMDDTQSFRLVETSDSMEITLHHVDGQNIIYWEDIEHIFPGVKRIHRGNSAIRFLRRPDCQW